MISSFTSGDTTLAIHFCVDPARVELADFADFARFFKGAFKGAYKKKLIFSETKKGMTPNPNMVGHSTESPKQ